MSQLGHKKIVFKSDSEPSILALKREAAKLLRLEYGIESILEEPPSMPINPTGPSRALSMTGTAW